MNSVKVTDGGNFILELKDPTATVQASLHYKAVKLFEGRIKVGVCVVINDYTTFCPYRNKRYPLYINLTVNNIANIFDPWHVHYAMFVCRNFFLSNFFIVVRVLIMDYYYGMWWLIGCVFLGIACMHWPMFLIEFDLRGCGNQCGCECTILYHVLN